MPRTHRARSASGSLHKLLHLPLGPCSLLPHWSLGLNVTSEKPSLLNLSKIAPPFSLTLLYFSLLALLTPWHLIIHLFVSPHWRVSSKKTGIFFFFTCYILGTQDTSWLIIGTQWVSVDRVNEEACAARMESPVQMHHSDTLMPQPQAYLSFLIGPGVRR